MENLKETIREITEPVYKPQVLEPWEYVNPASVEPMATPEALNYDRQIKNFQDLIARLRSEIRHNEHLINVAERNIENLLVKKEQLHQKPGECS